MILAPVPAYSGGQTNHLKHEDIQTNEQVPVRASRKVEVDTGDQTLCERRDVVNKTLLRSLKRYYT